MNRKDTIVELLRWLPEAIGGDGASDWIGTGPDSKHLTFGPLYYQAEGTWRELLRCLQLLKEERISQHAHLAGRFYGGYAARRTVRFTRGTRGEPDRPLGLKPNEEIQVRGGATSSKLVLDCLVYQWPAWVRARKVDHAVDFLAASFQGSPFLPVEVLAA